MKKRIAQIIIIVGIIIMLYPIVINKTTDVIMSMKIKEINNKVKEIEEMSNETLKELYEVLKGKNEELRNEEQEVKDSFSYEGESFNLREYGFEENIIGSIKIKKINVELPIYLGATVENLNNGATHVKNTSFPLGEKDSNVVIAAHSGLIRNRMFRDIDKLEKGDEVIITTLWDELRYAVIEKEIIEPTEVNKLAIKEQKDMVTLITCFNTHRYIVYCERVG